MQISAKLVIVLSLLVIGLFSIVSIAEIHYTESAVLDSGISDMKGVLDNKENQLLALHQSATSQLLLAVKNPIFVQYFLLPETKSGDKYDAGLLQFTQNQLALKNQMDQWIYQFQKSFPVDETCVVDSNGQEHTRIVQTVISPVSELDSSESNTPFYKPTFAKSEGEVNIQYPYISPDTHRLVFAYSTPIVLPDGEKPAFLHFEMPVSVFQDDLTITSGRMYVLDLAASTIIGDSANVHTSNAVSKGLFLPLSDISQSDDFLKLINTMKSNTSGVGTYSKDGQLHYMAFKKLPTFDWVIAYEKPYSVILGESTTLNDLRNTMLEILLVILAGGIITIVFVSKQITKPLAKLVHACRNQDVSSLTPIDDKKLHSDNEIGEVVNSINTLLGKINEYESELKIKNQELLSQKEQLHKLAHVGELASRLTHNLRNPLNVISGTVQVINATTKDKIDPSLQLRLDRISSSTKNMLEQINDVLSFVQSKPLEVEERSLLEVIKSAINHIEKPDTVIINLPENDIVFKCDSGKLQVVFMNLLTNAVQAMDNSGIIVIKFWISGDLLTINVQDSGPGISEDVLPKLFDSFFTTKSFGTGLGLPYCKNVVEQHGGKFEVTVNPTVFKMIFPYITSTSNQTLESKSPSVNKD